MIEAYRNSLVITATGRPLFGNMRSNDLRENIKPVNNYVNLNEMSTNKSAIRTGLILKTRFIGFGQEKRSIELYRNPPEDRIKIVFRFAIRTHEEPASAVDLRVQARRERETLQCLATSDHGCRFLEESRFRG